MKRWEEEPTQFCYYEVRKVRQCVILEILLAVLPMRLWRSPPWWARPGTVSVDKSVRYASLNSKILLWFRIKNCTVHELMRWVSCIRLSSRLETNVFISRHLLLFLKKNFDEKLSLSKLLCLEHLHQRVVLTKMAGTVSVVIDEFSGKVSCTNIIVLYTVLSYCITNTTIHRQQKISKNPKTNICTIVLFFYPLPLRRTCLFTERPRKIWTSTLASSRSHCYAENTL